ncbi:Abi family protein [Paraneptunicella aestuarii]|nr:Abi family protein [Paraneptunicella aestuarii]
MAESQERYDYAGCAEQIELSLSEERFKPYLLKAGHDKTYAFNLYLYNARLAKAFLFPLHILEVTLRNRINDIFQTRFGEGWHTEHQFLSKLNQESTASLTKAIARSPKNTTPDIVSTLTFDFWSNLFRDDYDRDFWQSSMVDLLPHVAKTRKEFQHNIKNINRFRNRIAHHEPIHKLNISVQHTEIIDTIGWLCTDTKDWVRHHSTVNSILRTSPSARGEDKPHFSERADNDFALIPVDTNLSTLPSKRFFICHDESKDPVSIIEKQHLYTFLTSKVEKDNESLLVSLSDYCLSDVIAHNSIKNNFIECSAEESLYKARKTFKVKGINYIIVRKPDEFLGVITKAHRQY